jgi:hypothetical protein
MYCRLSRIRRREQRVDLMSFPISCRRSHSTFFITAGENKQLTICKERKGATNLEKNERAIKFERKY